MSTGSVASDYTGLGLNAPTKEDRTPKKELGQAEFMKLLTTQLQHQDPFKPLDNAEFVAQMAQFSSLQSLQGMSTSFNTMATSLTSSQALQASAIVGRQVLAPGNKLQLNGEGGNHTVLAEVPSTSAVRVEVKDSKGNLVRVVDMGRNAKGDLRWEWDGRDATGQALPAGEYKVAVTATAAGKTETLKTWVQGRVSSVSLSGKGPAQLNVQGLGTVALSEVREISG